MREIYQRTIDAMRAEGCPFKGCLYFGLMLTQDGPKVIEYNCRFGDPEAQVVLPLLKTDLLSVMRAVEEEKLAQTRIEFSDEAACCVIVASGGYPEKYEKGYEISVGNAEGMDGVRIYHAGTALRDGRLVTDGGRVLGVTAVAKTLPEAVAGAYRAAAEVEFTGAQYRRDIGRRALMGGR
jgi:phosphoribosylamine--glycine ligase